MSAAVILQFALQLLPLVETGVPQFIAWLHTLRIAAQQAGEWTQAQDDAFLAAIKAKESDPAYQPDPPATPSTEGPGSSPPSV